MLSSVSFVGHLTDLYELTRWLVYFAVGHSCPTRSETVITGHKTLFPCALHKQIEIILVINFKKRIMILALFGK